MSFQNSGTTPDGQVFYRSDAILVLHLSHLLSGRVSEISTGDGGEVIVFPTVDQGVLNTMGTAKDGPAVPDTKYLAEGFHHQSTSQTRVGGAKPSLFCFAHETPIFAMGGAPPVPSEVTQEVPATEGNAPATAPLPATPPPAAHEDSKDLDHDGVVSRKEQKEFNRTHPHEAPAKKK